MKIIYKKSVMERLGEAIQEAHIQCKRIDCIELTGDEMREFSCEARRWVGPASSLADPMLFNGVRIVAGK